MAGRGKPYHPDARKARDMAMATINGWTARPRVPEELEAFARDIVRDSLVVAPQPLQPAWVKQSLAIVGRLVVTVVADGGPLTRQHVLSERTRNRFLYVHCAEHRPNTVSVYRTRLDLITMALNGVTVREPSPQPSLGRNAALVPHTPEEERALYAWATGLRPDQRRKRTVAMVTIGLGVGPDAPELIALRPEDCTVDEDGVHVTLTTRDGDQRVVTCRREWEEQFKALLDVTPPGHYLLTPWRDTPISSGTYSMVIWKTQERSTPPAYFCTRSLRNTWLVRLMEQGVPVPTLLEAAGLRSEKALFHLLSFCRTQTPGERAASLRGTVPTITAPDARPGAGS